MTRKDKTIVVSGAILGTLCALVLTVAARAAVISDENYREEFHQTYALSASGRVSLENINGAVKITGWDRNEVKLDAVKTADEKEKLARIEIRVDAQPNSIHIKTKYPDCEDHGCHNPGSVEYTLMVPRGALLDEVKTVNGALSVDQVNGKVHGASVNGQVTGTNLGGPVELSTVNGEVTATFASGRMKTSEPVTLNSVNGRVEAVLPSDASAELNAHTVNGGIRTDFNLTVSHPRYGPGSRLEGRLADGGAKFEFRTVNGSISIRHAADGRPLSPATSLLPPDRDRMY